MANMSYCRFQNTLLDLRDCYDAINSAEADDEKLSEEELKAKKRLLMLCKTIAKRYPPEEEEK